MDPNWKQIKQDLAAPFKPSQVHWRINGNAKGDKAPVLCYLDARDVQDRLDDVVGPENWSFDWQPLVTNATGLLVAKGVLTIYGVSKADVGDASTFEGNKGTVSDTLKRCGVMWGIGRYLYDVPSPHVAVANGQITPTALEGLVKSLAKFTENKFGALPKAS